MNNDFIISLIASLNRQLSKQRIKNDLKSLDDSLYIKIISRLSLALSKRQLKRDLEQLNDLYLQVGADLKVDGDLKKKLQDRIKTLQDSIADLQIGMNAKKSSDISRSVSDARNKAQRQADKAPINFNLDIKKEKVIADIEYIGKKYSKLFSDADAAQKYNSILNAAYGISDNGELARVRAQMSAFTSELKANDLASKSLGDKWEGLVERSKDLFSAASIVATVFSQVRQSISSFLQLDTAMTNLYKVQDQITSRDQFSGLLDKWNKLAQNLAVTTDSLINSAAEWSKIGFDLNMSEQLAQITSVFEKTAEISNSKASAALISAAQAFTEIDDLGVDDYVKRVEAVGDKINAIGNKYSIDSEGIADGLQNASAALKVAGNDLNETIALISATNKIYQSPSEASNMLKVASMRLRGQVDTLKEMGEDAEGVSTDLTKIQQQIYELTGNKVNIFEDEDNLKSTYQMMLEIGQVFDSLTDRQQADLLEKMFGKQRASAGASLLLNYEELEKIKNDSMNAAGSMAEEYGKYMESAEAHITVFKEKLIETYSSFMSGDLIKYTADVGSGILDLVNSTDLLRHGIIGILALNIGKSITNIGTAIASTFKQMDMLGSALQQIRNLPINDVSRVDTLYELGESTKRLSDNNLKLLLSQRQLSEQDRISILSARGLVEEEAKAKLEKMGLVTATKAQSAANVAEAATTTTLSGAMLSLKASIIGIGTSIKAAFFANPIGMSIMAISMAVSIATTVMSKYKESINKANEATKEAIETLQSITSEVESLENKITEINQEINGLDPITDAQDIENLRLQNEELATQLAILKEKQHIAGLEADKAAQDSLNTRQDSKYKFNTFADSTGGLAVVATQVTKEEELLNAIEAYDSYKARVDEANKALADMAKTGDYTQKEWDVQEKAIEKYSDGMLKVRSHANELAVELTEQVQGLNGSTEASQALINSVEASIAGYNKWIGTIDNTTDSLKEQADVQAEVAENASLFNITDHEKSIDEIQSTVDTLRKALDSFNQGTLDESAVLDLMQQFPALIPYIDLAADGFGNLSQGLSILIAQQPDALIESLEQLKASLNTDEERAQVDMLIDSLQQLSSYGDTGMEAYATSIGATWNDTANVIGSVTTQFENLAKVQEAVSNGLTMSATAAAELAQMYPEILTNCEVAANGQITLNEDVVKSILAGDQSIVDAQITKLEADKAVLTAKKSFAEAQLEMVKQVGEGEGKITEEVAQYRINIANQLLKTLIDAGMEEDKAYAAVAANMAGNMLEYNRIVGEVAENSSSNMDRAAVLMAKTININSINMQKSFEAVQKKAQDLAVSIASAAVGKVAGRLGTYSGGGSTSMGAIKADRYDSRFNKTSYTYGAKELSLDDFQSQLELDIKGYTDAIANIDGQIAVLKNLQATFKDTVDSANGGIGGHNYADKIKELEDEKDEISSALDDAKSGSGSSSKEAEDNFEELVDFFLRRIDVLDSALSLLKAHLDNVTGAFAKNQLVDAQLGITEEKFKNYSDALNMYTQKANEALSKLPSDIAAKVKDGAVDLTTFIGEGNKDVVEAIKDYENWADRITDCKNQLAELKGAIRELELQKFENIMQDYQDMFDLREDSKSLISKQIALLEEAGELIGESFFNAQIDQSKKQLALLEEEKAQLVSQMESAINSGRVEKASDEWIEMANSISDVEGNILDCKKAIEEFDNELLNLNWQIFDRIQTEFGNISSELDNLAGLFDDFNDIRVSDGKGTWTREAIATLGLYAQQYEVAKYQVEQYSDAMDKLKQDYIEGRFSATEYMDKLADLSSGQWEAVNSAESLEDAIYNLNKTRIDEEIATIEDEVSKYKELTDELIKNLEAQKDLHDYKESIAEKNKTITDLEKEIAAMSGDTSAATQAKIKLKQQQLAEARKDLEEYEYQHSIDSQKDALNKSYEDFESRRQKEIDDLKLSLENRELIISQSFENVKVNADIVGQEIANIAVQHGVTVSDAIITSWQNGEGAIASYGSVLNNATSAFIGNLMGVEYKVYDLQNQANATADTLAWMFGTRADMLVNELTTSYYSEQNLANMTNALQQSLVNALERGYNISSITNALGSIESAARSAKAAIDSLNSTPVNTSPSYNGGSGGGGNGSSGSGSGSSGSNIRYSGGYDERFSNGNKYNLINVYTGRVDESGLSYSQAWEKQKKTGMYEIKKMAKGGIVTKDPHSPLNAIAEAVGEDTIIAAKEGEAVITEKQTDSLQKFVDSIGGYKDGDVYVIPSRGRSDSQVPLENMSGNLAALDPVSLSNNIRSMPEIASSNVDKSVKISYGSLVTINGNVNDTHAFIDDTQKMIRKELVRHDREVVRSYRYG